MNIKEPLTKMVIHTHVLDDHQVFEGEVPMSQAQQDGYKQLIGDGNASITVSREMSYSDYGKGGKVFVSVTLTVDQSQQGIEAGAAWAKAFADNKVMEAHNEMQARLVQLGIVR